MFFFILGSLPLFKATNVFGVNFHFTLTCFRLIILISSKTKQGIDLVSDFNLFPRVIYFI